MMNDLGLRLRGRIRLIRGRCPACASETAGDCGVCLGYAGPYPPDDQARTRWGSRFERMLHSDSAPDRVGRFVSTPILRSPSPR